MKTKSLIIALSLFGAFGLSAHAQSKFAGRYDLLAGYSQGVGAGLFGFGTASVARSGAASYSIYWPYLGTTGKGTGRIDRAGKFSFTDGTRGNASLMGSRVAVGNFSGEGGKGFFGLRKK